MTTFSNTQGNSIQLKSSQLKQCDSSGTNIFPITKVSNVLMDDGRTLTQYLNSLSTNIGTEVEVTTNYTDGIIIGTIRVNGKMHYLVVPMAGISTVIEGNEVGEVFNYVGVPKLNPDDFYFNDAGETSTIIDFSSTQNGNLITVGKIVDGNGNKKTDIQLPQVTIDKRRTGDGSFIIGVKSWGGTQQIVLTPQEIYTAIKNLIPHDDYELSASDVITDGNGKHIELNLLKNGEVYSTVNIPVSVDDYKLVKDYANNKQQIKLLKGTQEVSRAEIDSDISLSIVERNVSVSNGLNESTAEIPIATNANYGVAIYDGQVPQDKKPVYINDGRPYVDRDIDAIDTTNAKNVLFIVDEYNNSTYYKELEHRLFYPKLYFASREDFMESQKYHWDFSCTNLKIAGNKISIRCVSIACRGYLNYSYMANGVVKTGVILFSLDTPGQEVCGILMPRNFSCKMFHLTTEIDQYNPEGKSINVIITLNDSNVSDFVITKLHVFTYKGATFSINGKARPSGDLSGYEPSAAIDFGSDNRYVLVDETLPSNIIAGRDMRVVRYVDVVLDENQPLTESDIYEMKFLEYESRINALEARLQTP